MNEHELREVLQALRAEIGRLNLEPAESERLQRLLEAAEAGDPGVAEVEERSLSEELSRSIDRFELEHPRFTALLGRLVSSLSAMGI